MINKVSEFQKAFNQEVNESPCNILNYKLRHSLMEEENREYFFACINEDLVEIADALADQLYILYGTILSHGMQHIIEDVFNEVHRSNMTKLVNGKPLINGVDGIIDTSKPFGKILKPDTYESPKISNILFGNSK